MNDADNLPPGLAAELREMGVLPEKDSTPTPPRVETPVWMPEFSGEEPPF